MEETTAPVIHRRVLKFALPISLSNATEPILGAVDTGVVGQMGQAALIGAVGTGAGHPVDDQPGFLLSADGHHRVDRAGARRG